MKVMMLLTLLHKCLLCVHTNTHMHTYHCMTLEHPLVLDQAWSLLPSPPVCYSFIHTVPTPDCTTACRGAVCSSTMCVSLIYSTVCSCRLHFKNPKSYFACRLLKGFIWKRAWRWTNVDTIYIHTLLHLKASIHPILQLLHLDSPGVLNTCSQLPLALKPSWSTNGQTREMADLILSTVYACKDSSITDPTVRDKVLSCREGWQINLNPDWWTRMQFSGLVWVQQYEEEKVVSINRSRDLQGGVSGSSVILSRVKLCLEQNKEGHTIELKISLFLKNGNRTYYEKEVVFFPCFRKKLVKTMKG